MAESPEPQELRLVLAPKVVPEPQQRVLLPPAVAKELRMAVLLEPLPELEVPMLALELLERVLAGLAQPREPAAPMRGLRLQELVAGGLVAAAPLMPMLEELPAYLPEPLR